MANDIFSIDGSDVNERIDWRHDPPTTVLTAQRYEGFPGWGGLYSVVGEPTGVVLSIHGFLEASNFAGLHGKLLAAYAIRNAADLHTVRIHGEPYNNMVLDRVVVRGKNTAFRHTSGDVWVRVLVTYLWRQIIPGGA